MHDLALILQVFEKLTLDDVELANYLQGEKLLGVLLLYKEYSAKIAFAQCTKDLKTVLSHFFTIVGNDDFSLLNGFLDFPIAFFEVLFEAIRVVTDRANGRKLFDFLSFILCVLLQVDIIDKVKFQRFHVLSFLHIKDVFEEFILVRRAKEIVVL